MNDLLNIALESTITGLIYSIFLISTVFSVRAIWNWDEKRQHHKMRRFEEENFNSFEPEEILPSFIELRTDSEKNENFEESDILTKIINDLEKGEITDYLRENYSVTVQRQVGLKMSQ